MVPFGLMINKVNIKPSNLDKNLPIYLYSYALPKI